MAFLKMVLMVMVLFCALVSTDYVGTAQRMEKAQETNTAVNKINTEGIANALGISTTQMISPGTMCCVCGKWLCCPCKSDHV